MAYIGQALLRGEDPKYLRGRGRYTDDIEIPDCLYAAFIRSPHAHARIIGIDTTSANRCRGVKLILTGDDWDAAGLGRLPCISTPASADGKPMNVVERPVFATDSVKHVGDPVAAVIAESPEQAVAAAELIEVEYEELPAVTSPQSALDPDAPLVHPQLESNLAHWTEYGDRERTEAAFAGAHHVEELKIHHARVCASPIEPRAYLADFDLSTERYTLWASGQNPHFLRRLLATHTLKIGLSKLRVVCPDVGGGFGIKYYCYPEQAVVLWASKVTGKPVRWTSTRSEAFATDTHARHHDTTVAMAFDQQGAILALRCESTPTYGAYQSTFAPIIVMMVLPDTLLGMYKIPCAYVRVNGVFTHTTPVDAYRGVKQAAAYLHERVLDQAARGLGIDPLDLRLRNYIECSEYPYRNALGSVYDSADPARQHATLAELVDYQALRVEQRARGEHPVRMGIGVSAVLESTGLGPSRMVSRVMRIATGGWESALLRVHPDAKVTLFPGTHSHGQSHEISFRQIAADALGIPIDDIEFTQGDTDLGPGNLGTAAGRSISTAGLAVAAAAGRIIEKGKRLAAHQLECALEDVSYELGNFQIPGTDRGISFAEIALLAHSGASYPEEGFELGLEETVFFDPVAMSYPTALHLVVVLVDTETGEVRLRNYYTVDDCGRVVNPNVVQGQVHGGLAQGIGQALLEQIVYESESGQLLTGSFIDYAMPRADHMPGLDLAFQETLNPNHPLGIKGCSETGIVGAPAAICNAILDALHPLGVDKVQIPATSEQIWRAIKDAGG